MANLSERLQILWNSAKAGRAMTTAHFMVSRDHVDRAPGVPGTPFQAQQHYFQILINEMYLAHWRKWFVTYSPMALVATHYVYGRRGETSPFVIGPSLLKDFAQESAQGFTFHDTPVTDLHPYQGGPLTLTVLFSEVQHQNNGEKVLQVLESISSLTSPAAPAIDFSVYLKLAGRIMDGIETLLGLSQTNPLLGYRVTINPDIGQKLEPAYLVLVNAPESDVDPQRFWVREGRLYHGPSLEAATPYRQHDFLLLSITQGNQRTDERTLPFYPLWEETRDLALRASNDHFWKETKAHFNTLKRHMLNSPDLTKPDFERLTERYLAETLQHRASAVQMSDLAAADGMPVEEQRMARLAAALDELDEM